MTTTPWPEIGSAVITDGGLETWLVFLEGVDLPAFAAYPLVDDERGRALFRDYYTRYLAIADAHGAAALLDAPTWRANPDWGDVLGHDRSELGRLIDVSMEMMHQIRSGYRGGNDVLVGAAVGPRGDGYRVDTSMTIEEATEYHGFQVTRSAAAGADVVTAMTMGYVEEGAGVALAARAAGVASVVSFTVETDGRLPCGMALGEAIIATDEATGSAPHHYMVNCAHPTHFASIIEPGSAWAARIGGLRANASTLSHAELDEMTELDDGDPADLARRYLALGATLPNLQVLGGCCGTDDRHVAAIADAWYASR